MLSAPHKMKSQTKSLSFYILSAMISQVCYCYNEKRFIPPYQEREGRKKEGNKKRRREEGKKSSYLSPTLNYRVGVAKLKFIPICETSETVKDALSIFSSPTLRPTTIQVFLLLVGSILGWLLNKDDRQCLQYSTHSCTYQIILFLR